jgi:hypothetical protein
MELVLAITKKRKFWLSLKLKKKDTNLAKAKFSCKN